MTSAPEFKGIGPLNPHRLSVCLAAKQKQSWRRLRAKWPGIREIRGLGGGRRERQAEWHVDSCFSTPL